MENKRLAWMMVFVYCLISTFILNNCFAQGSDDEAIFKDRLYTYLSSHSNLDFSISEQQLRATNNLRNFSEEYLDSTYADDASYIPIIFAASSNKDVAALEQLIKKYPNGKIEDFTVKFIEGMLGPGLPELYMLYDLALIYFKGEKSFTTERNYGEAIKYYSDFIGKADEKNPKMRTALRFAYSLLVISYRNLDRRSEGEEIKNKAIALFPEDKEKIEKVWSSPIPK